MAELIIPPKTPPTIFHIQSQDTDRLKKIISRNQWRPDLAQLQLGQLEVNYKGIHRRTLQAKFLHILGISPMTYIKVQ